jgi:hypothetical protein
MQTRALWRALGPGSFHHGLFPTYRLAGGRLLILMCTPVRECDITAISTFTDADHTTVESEGARRNAYRAPGRAVRITREIVLTFSDICAKGIIVRW